MIFASPLNKEEQEKMTLVVVGAILFMLVVGIFLSISGIKFGKH
jgi:hypothetical protein